LEERRCTVFGATGFVGHAIVARLSAEGWHVRAVARQPTTFPDPPDRPSVERISADLRDKRKVSSLLHGTSVAINTVSLYHPTRQASFEDIHVGAAQALAAMAREHGLKTLIHMSGIGADSGSRSPYIAARGRGEQAVRETFPKAVILRPSAIFSPEDSFLNNLIKVLRRTPIFPLFGDGETRLQPVYLGDVAAAVARIAEGSGIGSEYELGGPDVLSYRGLLELLCRYLARKPRFLPVPFWVWDLLANSTAFLERPPVTEGMVALMRRDNVVGAGVAGFSHLGVNPRSIGEILPEFPSQRDL
jgi:NADH dehydrogenase